ncbi:MAG: oxidoreductase [Alphaproteobacteria bacterium]|nr:oxidoreductase [Alphaproteobacteria bacterium]
MALQTALTEMLGITHPIISAPMATVSGGALASAVTVAGGLGLIGGGYGDRDWIERELRAAGNTRVGVGFITWRLAERPELLDLALDHSPAAIFLSFGDPASFAARAKSAGVPVICQVQTLAHARSAVAAGADIIVAQGTEAGGHGGARTTMTLVPAVVDAVAPVPVVAAGGISDGRGLAAALTLGAAGVLIGTRFFATSEALGHDNTKARLVSAGGDDTVRSSVFDIVRELPWPAAYKVRTVHNALAERWLGAEDELRQEIETGQASGTETPVDRFQAAMQAGDTEEGVVVGGQGLDLVHAIEPAGDLVTRIVADAEQALAAATSLSRPG